MCFSVFGARQHGGSPRRCAAIGGAQKCHGAGRAETKRFKVTLEVTFLPDLQLCTFDLEPIVFLGVHRLRVSSGPDCGF